MKLRPLISGTLVVAMLLVLVIGVAWASAEAYEDTNQTQTADDLKGVLTPAIEVALPVTILIAVAVSIGGFAIALVKWLGGGTQPTRNFGR